MYVCGNGHVRPKINFGRRRSGIEECNTVRYAFHDVLVGNGR